MRFFLKFLLKAAANGGALWVAMRFIPQFALDTSVFAAHYGVLDYLSVLPPAQALIVAGLALALLNIFLRPALKLVGAILPLVTFAMLSIAFNAVLLYVGDMYLAELSIGGWKALLWSSFLLGAINVLI